MTTLTRPTTDVRATAAGAATSDAHRPVRLRGDRLQLPALLSAALGAVTVVGAGGTYVFGGELRGTPVMNGSARGTALVLVALALPVLGAAAARALRGSVAAVPVWIGATAYIAYNSVLLALATPFNRFFLVYEAMLALSWLTLGALLLRTDREAVARRLRAAPARGLAVYLGAFVVLNTLTWLRAVVPALGDPTPAFLEGSGLTTNPVYVQDLALWLPLAGLAAWWLWRRRAVGYLAAASVLVFWTLESVGVATDQWFGARAEPTSTLATTEGSVLFLVLAVVGLVPLALMFRRPRG